ncbi:hypothetical protein [Okeania sp.]|uniref:hypothetical protein n=1 Tax=Okeania sp. TaxID=3100323 RepID=UPI002B4B7011|nr:hypothetical protein [Okeania sp.]MEB3343655.1 hypothetical protein [Okeania sp.]
MSQNSIVKSTKNSTQELNQTLQGVMESLDVGLEAELTRYRKYRNQTEKSPISQRNISKQIYKTPELMSLLPVEEQTVPSSSTSEIESSLKNLETSHTSAPKAKPVAIEPPTPTEISMAKKGNIDAGSHKQISLLDKNKSTAPDNYLESSEKLLESLDKLKPSHKGESSYLASLFTPLGIAAMFVFLISCTALGYVLINPLSLSNFSLDRLFKGSSAQKNTDETTTDNNKGKALPKSPDLTSQEFVDLDLNTLSNVNPQPNQVYSPTVKAKPMIPPPISGGVNTLSQPSQGSTKLDNLGSTLLPQYNPSTKVTISSPTPSPSLKPSPKNSNSSPITNPVKSDDGWYYVVVDYANQESLLKAQAIISDAYLRQTTNGMKIQMGAFAESERAKMFLEELRKAGLNAKYYNLKPE